MEIVPPSEDSELTESTCTSVSEFLQNDQKSYKRTHMEEEKNERHDCGICQLRPRCLQRFANIKVFVFLCCILVTLQQTLSSGYLNSVITTIEKRFNITSGLSGAIASTYEIGNLITVIFVSYLGSRRHIPVWLGVGVIVMGIGSIVFVLPHFTTERYTVESKISPNTTKDYICKRVSSDRAGFFDSAADFDRPCAENGHFNSMAILLFMLAQLLIGCGGSPLFTLGTTYIDDHVKRESAALYIGCLYSMVAFGPVCGFLLGGYLLSFYVDALTYNADDLNMTADDPRWVGAWWGGFLIIGSLLLIVSIPVFAFPKRLRCLRKISSEVNDKSMTTIPSETTSTSCTFNTTYTKRALTDKEREKYGSSVRDIPRSMLNLFYNPVYTVTCIGSCMELIIVCGFVVFLPKYLETQFSISKSQANIFTGGIAIPGACVGIFLGGFVLKKFQLRPKGAAQFILICSLVCLVMYGVLIFLGCDNVTMAGATVSYANKSLDLEHLQVNLTADCNAGCHCSSNNFAPVCGINKMTYFSPCYAGCTTRTPKSRFEQDYSDCKCIPGNLHEGDVPVARTGPCPHNCYNIIPFMVLLFLMSLVVSVTQMPILMIVLRSVAEHERSFALGMQFVVFRLFGYIPSPIMFGNVIDSTCLLWKSHCDNNGGGGGFCLMYDLEQFRFKYVGICAGIKVVAASIFFVDWFLIQKVQREEIDITMAGDGNTSDRILPEVSNERPLRNRPPTPGPRGGRTASAEAVLT